VTALLARHGLLMGFGLCDHAYDRAYLQQLEQIFGRYWESIELMMFFLRMGLKQGCQERFYEPIIMLQHISFAMLGFCEIAILVFGRVELSEAVETLTESSWG
jgi:hypothetical protein